MKAKSPSITILFIGLSILLTLAACKGSADYDIRGTWAYTMIDSNDNTYDMGTIIFSGSPTTGTYTELNIYQIEYNGEYQVSGGSLNLTGDEDWQGTIKDANTMSGTWQHDDGFSGTWTALRQEP